MVLCWQRVWLRSCMPSLQQALLRTKPEKDKNNISKLTEECTHLNTKLKVERKTNENMQDALDLANEKIEDMSTAQQGLFDNISELKQTNKQCIMA